MLTPPQLKALLFIDAYIKGHRGISPSFQEISNHIGSPSKSRASDVLDQLEERGWIRRLARRARSIEILRAPPPAATASPWSPISTLPDRDDLVWLYNIATRSLDGPRPPGVNDPDRFDYWSPCEAPEPFPTAEKGPRR